MTVHPGSDGALSVPVCAWDVQVSDMSAGIAVAKQSMFGGKGWQGNKSKTRHISGECAKGVLFQPDALEDVSVCARGDTGSSTDHNTARASGDADVHPPATAVTTATADQASAGSSTDHNIDRARASGVVVAHPSATAVSTATADQPQPSTQSDGWRGRGRARETEMDQQQPRVRGAKSDRPGPHEDDSTNIDPPVDSDHPRASGEKSKREHPLVTGGVLVYDEKPWWPPWDEARKQMADNPQDDDRNQVAENRDDEARNQVAENREDDARNQVVENREDEARNQVVENREDEARTQVVEYR